MSLFDLIFKKATGEALLAMARAWQRGEFLMKRDQHPRIEESRRRGSGDQAGTACLLHPVRGHEVGMAWEMLIDTSAYIVDVQVLGYPESAIAGTFQLTIGDDQGLRNVTIPFDATASEFQDLTDVRGQVSLGAKILLDDDGEEVLYSPARWRIRYSQSEDAETFSAGSTSNSQYFAAVSLANSYGAGSLIEVVPVIPSGWNTPYRAGAVVAGIVSRGQLQIHGLEPRYWFPGTGGSGDGYG